VHGAAALPAVLLLHAWGIVPDSAMSEPTPRLKPTRSNGLAQPSLRATREATLRRPRPGKRGVARRAIPSAPKASTPAAEVGFHGGGEGMWPPLRRPGERECNGSGLEERVTPTETEGSRVRMSLRRRPVERVRPLVDRLEPEPNPASVAGTGSDDVGESSVRSNPIERWASRSGPGIGCRCRGSAAGVQHPPPTGSRLSCSPSSCRS
jgi:hypothetical protein